MNTPNVESYRTEGLGKIKQIHWKERLERSKGISGPSVGPRASDFERFAEIYVFYDSGRKERYTVNPFSNLKEDLKEECKALGILFI